MNLLFFEESDVPHHSAETFALAIDLNKQSLFFSSREHYVSRILDIIWKRKRKHRNRKRHDFEPAYITWGEISAALQPEISKELGFAKDLTNTSGNAIRY